MVYDVAPGERELSSGAERLLALLDDLPMATVGDVAPLTGASSSAVYDRMLELRQAGHIDSVGLGWSRPRSMRWYLTDAGLSLLGHEEVTWHHEGLRSRLLERLPSLEFFYHLIPQITSLGAFQGFLWLRGRAADAIVKYQLGWVALFWSGTYQSDNIISGRLERLPMDFRGLKISRQVPWPGMLLFVVSDQWQRELVYRAARKHRYVDQVMVWCPQDGEFAGIRQSRASRGGVNQVPDTRGMGGWEWARRVRDLPWSERRGIIAGRVLDVVSQWPGASLHMLKQSLRESSSGRSAHHACRVLQEGRAIDRLWEDGKYHYTMTPRGIETVARRDRVHYSEAKGRFDSLSWVNSVRLRVHEDGVMSLIGQFMEAGLPVAAGWRSWENLGQGGGGIAPDGMVFLRESPFGPTWAYIEYERSARGAPRVRRKLNGYGSKRRGDDWPVLVVCWDDDAESAFQAAGRRLHIPMLTATIERLEDHGAVGNPACWSMYGEPATLG